jgi:hypothetical protein
LMKWTTIGKNFIFPNLFKIGNKFTQWRKVRLRYIDIFIFYRHKSPEYSAQFNRFVATNLFTNIPPPPLSQSDPCRHQQLTSTTLLTKAVP